MQQWRDLSEAYNSICLKSTVNPKDTYFTELLATYLKRQNKTYLATQWYTKIVHLKCNAKRFQLAAYISYSDICLFYT